MEKLPGATMLAHGAVFLEAIDGLAEGAWRDLPAPSSMLGSVVAGGARRRTEEQLELGRRAALGGQQRRSWARQRI
jgi:type III pantothenate kinase